MQIGQARWREINALLQRTLDERKHLIAVHRGSWGGNITQNTVGAYKAALGMGADMVESDVISSTDGVLFSFHDGYEEQVLGTKKGIKTMSAAEIESYHPITSAHGISSARINRLEEVLDFLPEGALINIDRAWDIFPQLVRVLDRYPQHRQKILLKAPLRAKAAYEFLNEYPVKYMFMPICTSMAHVEAALEYKDINLVGMEIDAETPQDDLYQDETIAFIHDRGLFVWVNSITLGNIGTEPLFGGLDDDISILEGPEKGWGKLMDKHIDILQTDWPALLYNYRKARFGK